MKENSFYQVSDCSKKIVKPKNLVFRIVDDVPILFDTRQKLFLRVPHVTGRLLDEDSKKICASDKKFEMIQKSLSKYGVSTYDMSYNWPYLGEIPPQPNAIRMEITNVCNMKCKYCFNSSEPSKTSTLPADIIIDTIDNFTILGGRVMVFSGGEPLLHPEILKVLTHSTNSVYRTCLATNGLLLKGEILESLCSLPIYIAISLDGLTAESHDCNRLAGSFDIVRRNLLSIAGRSERLCSIGVAMTVTATNYDQVRPMVQFAKENGLDYLAICLPKRQGRALECWETIRLSVDQQIDLHEYVTEQCNLLEGFMDIEGAHYNQVNAFFIKKDMPELNCRPGEALKVTSDGKIFGCPQTESPDFEIGNLVSGGLKQALTGNVLKNIRQRVWERLYKLKECFDCEWFSLCQGGCPCDALDFHSKMEHPDSFCQARKQTFERTFARLVREGIIVSV